MNESVLSNWVYIGSGGSKIKHTEQLQSILIGLLLPLSVVFMC